MDDNYQDNPALNPIFEGRDLTRLSTSYDPHNAPRSESKPKIPPLIGEIVGKLGLRYRPSGQADLEAHAQALLLLTEDLSDVPPPLLDRATRQWVRDSKFMPKASEILELCRLIQKGDVAGTDAGAEQLQAHCNRLNESAHPNGRNWIVVGTKPNRTVALSTDYRPEQSARG